MTITALATAFPFSPQIDSVMAHHHLVAAYFFTWGLQLAYLGFIAMKWKAVNKSDRP